MAERVIDTLVTRWLHRTDTRQLDGMEARINKVRSGLNAASRGFTVAGGALTTALFGVGRTVLSFETEMNNLQAVLGAGADDMDRLRAHAKELGSQLPVSTSEVVQAQTNLAKAGLSTQEIIEALPGVLELAIAGQLGLEEAAGIVTSTLAAFNLEAGESGRVSDVLAKAATSAKTDVRLMGVAFRQAAPLASQLGVPIEEVSALLAILQDNGLKAETSGVGVRNMMTRLVNPTKEVRDALDTLGVEYDVVLDLLNQGRLVDAIRLLANAGLDAGTAAKLFGAETVGAALIAAKSTDDVDKLEASLRKADGTTKRMVETQLQGLPGAWERLKSSFEDAQLALGDAGITGALEKLLNKAREALVWFVSLDDSTKTLVAGVLLAGPALIALGVAVKGVSFALGAFLPALKLASLALKGLIALTPVGWAAAAVAGIALLILYWEEITGFIKDAGVALANLLREWGVPVDDIFQWITDAWEAMVGTLTAPGALWDWIREQVPTPFQWLMDAWEVMTAFLAAPVQGIWGFLYAGDNPFGPVTDAWNALMELLGVEQPDIFGWISRQWQAVMDGLLTLIPEPVKWLFGLKDPPEGMAQQQRTAVGTAPPPETGVSATDQARNSWLARIRARDQQAGTLLATGAGVGAGSVTTARTANTNVNVEKIEVMAQGGDPETIAAGISSALDKHLHDTVEDYDDGTAR